MKNQIILIGALLLVFAVIFAINKCSPDKNRVSVKVINNEKALRQEEAESIRIQDSLGKIFKVITFKNDSLKQLNENKNLYIKQLQSEKDTIITAIPLRNGKEYERFLSDYFKRYHRSTDH